MLACIYKEDKTLELVDRPIPKAKKDSAVIKVNATSICGTDFRTYVYGSAKIKPGTIIGHEMCGTIVEIGEDVKDFKVGDVVQVAPALGCGECYMCSKGHYNMCDNLTTLGFQYDGSFAEYMEIPARFFDLNSVSIVPNTVLYTDASLAEPIACVVNAQEFLNIQQGDYVAVFGSGFIGCMHAELAFASGAEKVIMIEPNPVRAAEAKELVKDIIMINSAEVDLVKTVHEITGGRGADVVITACSVGAAQVSAQEIAAKRARISLFGGLPGDGKGYIDSNLIHYKEFSVFGVHASTAEQNRKVLKWIADGTINVHKYISKVYPLSEILTAFKDIKEKGIMKAVIQP